ncbi:MAG: hypothetical protein KA138_16700 [Saprospiraceae bacterium]|nr:hypothetical protein [Saprospiraceae bacterium]
MSEIQDRVKSLTFRFKGLEYETNGFTWDYTAATDEQVFDVAPVAQDTIDGLTEIILKIVKPQHRQKLKKQIAYLIGLRHRQQEVWAKQIEDFQNRTNNVNQWVLQHTR